jgi:hypothetical protein
MSIPFPHTHLVYTPTYSLPLLLRSPSGNSLPSIVLPFDKFGFVVHASAYLDLDAFLLKKAAEASILYCKLMYYVYTSLLRTCMQGLLAT